jgi:predicted small secreted protein
MKKLITLTVLSAAGALALSSCETATGTGAVVGAATGAAIGANTGPHGYYRDNTGRAITGAAIGAGAGALIGAAIDANRAREYEPAPAGGYPYARRVAPGLFESPYTGRVYNLRGIPPGSLVRDQDTNRVFRKP